MVSLWLKNFCYITTKDMHTNFRALALLFWYMECKIDFSCLCSVHGNFSNHRLAKETWYRDGAGNIIEENSSVFSLI